MDDQRQIQSGVGLQESRLNEDFINFLRKWGPFFTYGVLGIVVAWLGFGQYNSYQERQTDAAFADLAAADVTGTVAAYDQVAKDWEGRAAVSTLARLQAARVLQLSALLGLQQGAPTTGFTEDQVLSDEERATTWRASIEVLEQVRDSESARGRAIFAQRARWMIANAQISLGEFDQAKQTLESFIREAGEDAAESAVARERIARLPLLETPVMLSLVEPTPQATPITDGLLGDPSDSGSTTGVLSDEELEALIRSGQPDTTEQPAPEQVSDEGEEVDPGNDSNESP